MLTRADRRGATPRRPTSRQSARFRASALLRRLSSFCSFFVCLSNNHNCFYVIKLIQHVYVFYKHEYRFLLPRRGICPARARSAEIRDFRRTLHNQSNCGSHASCTMMRWNVTSYNVFLHYNMPYRLPHHKLSYQCK